MKNCTVSRIASLVTFSPFFPVWCLLPYRRTFSICAEFVTWSIHNSKVLLCKWTGHSSTGTGWLRNLPAFGECSILIKEKPHRNTMLHTTSTFSFLHQNYNLKGDEYNKILFQLKKQRGHHKLILSDQLGVVDPNWEEEHA